jgi:multiple sugar transport system substrate-binding protein
MEMQGPWVANIILTKKPGLAGLKPGETDDPEQPLADRQKRYLAAVAPFPSAEPGLNNVAYVEFDALVIPRGAKHKKEAFEFMAFINRQDIMERLCEMHTTNSPLMQVSDHFLQHNKNAFIGVYEMLARSPNAHSCPQIPIFPEVGDELINALRRVALLDAEPRQALQEAQDRMQVKYDAFMDQQRARGLDAGMN